MFESFRLTNPVKLTFTFIILLIIYSDDILSNVHTIPPLSHVVRTDPIVINIVHEQVSTNSKFGESSAGAILFNSRGSRFEERFQRFVRGNKCGVQFFMTWFSKTSLFMERELFGLESLFANNPDACLVILSDSMDSGCGRRITKPLTDRGFRVTALAPDLDSLVKDTPAEKWVQDIKDKVRDPGEIPLAQNLSNLVRLAVLYKYGGVYLDTDFVILKDFSRLRNTIGAQSVDVDGNWTRLNNAVLVFDKGHRVLYKFIEEFASTFDGNRWGHNGPYLVSRVARTGEFANFTILPPKAFYPVDWTRVEGYLVRPDGRVGMKWVEAKLRQLSEATYGVHLWNKQSRELRIEEGSIISRLVAQNCVTCSRRITSSVHDTKFQVHKDRDNM